MNGQQQKLLDDCKLVLKLNDLGGWTRPAPNLYPHQWLWDSCFIAIGRRHYNIKRAQKEIESLFRGQWDNGMVPNIVYGKDLYYADNVWDSRRSPNAPRDVATSGITQPPMIATAITKIGELMPVVERRKWYAKMYPKVLAYHEWLYRERDPHGEGLVELVHPWESGLDNTPPWMHEIRKKVVPLWIRTIHTLKLDVIIELIRKDTRHVSATERTTTVEQLTLYSIARFLRRKRYDSDKILPHASVLVEDLTFNCILIHANRELINIATELNMTLPGWLWERMKKAPHALELLWNESHQQYFSRNAQTFKLITEPSIAAFMPLYAGTISKHKAQQLVDLLKNKSYDLLFPVPTAPKNSRYFQPKRYWQGPTWINTNWLIIEGLRSYDFHKEADALRLRSLELVRQHGSYEYFNPLDGSPAGIHPFSWTAALTIDLLESKFE